ncbi:hypothetical protein J4437_03015 [Candidatus Woesearchaeota archaeon]|nr:hypothetical protein [Candidatus Woesearchaeota archaeon]
MSNKLLSLVALFVISLLALPSALSLDAGNFGWSVEVNGDEVEFGNLVDDKTGTEEVYYDAAGDGINFDLSGNLIINTGDFVVPSISVEEGQAIDIKVTLDTFSHNATTSDVELEARIKGYEYSARESLSDSTPLFDIAANTQKTKTLSLTLPRNLEKQVYWLHLTLDSANSASIEAIVKLNVEPVRHGVGISDVSFSPGNTIKAGRSLLTTVLLENFGDKPEDDVKVTVAIPELGVSAVEYVDDSLTSGANDIEFEDVPEMFLPIPATAVAGDYKVEVTVEYDRFEEVKDTYTIHVLENEQFQPADEETLVLAVGPETQNVQAGQTARYAIALTNAGSKSRAYLLSSSTGTWATVALSNSLVVLEPGKNTVVYVDVTASADAAQGTQTVPVAISANNEVLETVNLGATVTAAPQAVSNSNVSLRTGLEIALIVLVVVLVIIGLIIGFSRLRKDDDEEEKKYY